MYASVVRLTKSPSAACAAMMWHTASGTPHSMASATPVKGWRSSSPRLLCRVLPSTFSYSSNLPTSAQDGARNHGVHVNAQRAAHELLHALSGLARDVHHATLVLHEGRRTIGHQQRERNAVEVVGRQRAELKRSLPGFRNLTAKLRRTNPFDFGPQLQNCLVQYGHSKSTTQTLYCSTWDETGAMTRVTNEMGNLGPSGSAKIRLTTAPSARLT
jgi:hypothetical protein